jgi:hypothetical protein
MTTVRGRVIADTLTTAAGLVWPDNFDNPGVQRNRYDRLCTLTTLRVEIHTAAYTAHYFCHQE